MNPTIKTQLVFDLQGQLVPARSLIMKPAGIYKESVTFQLTEAWQRPLPTLYKSEIKK